MGGCSVRWEIQIRKRDKMSCGCKIISSGCVGLTKERAKVNFLPPDLDLCPPLASLFVPTHALELGRRAARRNVSGVLRLGCLPKVGETVVPLDAIDMVDVLNRPFAMNNRPSYSVGLALFSADGD